MNLKLLFDGIVRQTTVLIAQLSTASGARPPLAHDAERDVAVVLNDLVRSGLVYATGSEALWDRVAAHNEAHPPDGNEDENEQVGVSFYAGQSVEPRSDVEESL